MNLFRILSMCLFLSCSAFYYWCTIVSRLLQSSFLFIVIVVAKISVHQPEQKSQKRLSKHSCPWSIMSWDVSPQWSDATIISSLFYSIWIYCLSYIYRIMIKSLSEWSIFSSCFFSFDHDMKRMSGVDLVFKYNPLPLVHYFGAAKINRNMIWYTSNA